MPPNDVHMPGDEPLLEDPEAVIGRWPFRGHSCCVPKTPIRWDIPGREFLIEACFMNQQESGQADRSTVADALVVCFLAALVGTVA
jgi:hypothetical protein